MLTMINIGEINVMIHILVSKREEETMIVNDRVIKGVLKMLMIVQ